MNNGVIVALLSGMMVVGSFGGKLTNISGDQQGEGRQDSLSQYRDTLVGQFNGVDIDTLICEPIGNLVKDKDFGDFYMEWRVYTTNGTVEELKIGNTIGIEFVKEDDLDGNKTEEWGFLNQWPTSSWSVYKIFTFEDGKWRLMVEPINIWTDHLDASFTESDIAQKSDKKGYIRIKSSAVIDDATNWVVLDSIVPVTPKDYTYELVEW